MTETNYVTSDTSTSSVLLSFILVLVIGLAVYFFMFRTSVVSTVTTEKTNTVGVDAKNTTLPDTSTNTITP